MRYWSKIAFFSHPLLHKNPLIAPPPREKRFLTTEPDAWSRLSNSGVNRFVKSSPFTTEYARYRRADRQTDGNVT